MSLLDDSHHLTQPQLQLNRDRQSAIAPKGSATAAVLRSSQQVIGQFWCPGLKNGIGQRLRRQSHPCPTVDKSANIECGNWDGTPPTLDGLGDPAPHNVMIVEIAFTYK